jgi:lipoprotein-releasing system permease protein
MRIGYRQPMKANIAEEAPIAANDRLYRDIQNNPDVASIYPFATKYAILKTAEEMEGVLLKGLDKSYPVHQFKSFMQEGRWIVHTDSTYAREIVVSAYTAKQLNLKLNDRILIYFVKPDGSLRPDKLMIVGIYKTGIEEYDKTFAIGDIRLIRRLNEWAANEIGGYELFLNNPDAMSAASQQIFEFPGFPQEWDTRTVKEIYPHIFDWLEVINTNSTVLISIMIVIALINLITCLIILVLERIRMIGVLKALGATNRMVQRVFLFHAAFITLLGIVIGTFVALGILWLQQATGFIRLPEDAYYMDRAAVKIIWWHVAAVVSGTLIVSFLILSVPTVIVKKVRPVKAIQFR